MTVPFRKNDYYVDKVPVKLASAFIQQWHYARGASHTAVYIHGLYDLLTDELVGVVWWLPPTKPAAMSVHPEDWRRVLSLSRMAIKPGVPKNACSFLQARSIKLIKSERRFFSLVTYADESQGHSGHVYLTSGWTYMGRTKTANPRWIDPKSGRQVSVLSTKSRTVNQMSELGYVVEGHYRKHKFVRYLRKVDHERFCEL